jgi:alpha-methylacyl-CoA racemase
VVDVAMTEGAAYLGSMTRTFLALGGWTDTRAANMLDGGAPNYRCYETSDGKFMAVGALEPQFWAALVGAIGREVESTPSPYDPAQWTACEALLTDVFATKTRDEWAEIFAPLDACVAPVLTLVEAPEHPHNVARRSYMTVGDAVMAGPAPKFSATPGEGAALTEMLADGPSLLAEAGYSEAEIGELKTTGTVG